MLESSSADTGHKRRASVSGIKLQAPICQFCCRPSRNFPMARRLIAYRGVIRFLKWSKSTTLKNTVYRCDIVLVTPYILEHACGLWRVILYVVLRSMIPSDILFSGDTTADVGLNYLLSDVGVPTTIAHSGFSPESPTDIACLYRM